METALVFYPSDYHIGFVQIYFYLSGLYPTFPILLHNVGMIVLILMLESSMANMIRKRITIEFKIRNLK